MNNTKKVNVNIIIMCIIGIVLSVITILISISIEMFLVMGILPLACCVGLLITKHPIFAILFTALFVLNRITIFFGGTLLAILVIVGLIAYFIYVDKLCYQQYKSKKNEKENGAEKA